MTLHFFTFNPFQENTYIVSDDNNKSCTVIDPGFYDENEFDTLQTYLQDSGLSPTKIVLTHAHVDHVFGLSRLLSEWEVPFYMHDKEVPVLEACPSVASMYGVQCAPVGEKHISLANGDTIQMGGVEWDVFFTPGHSPGSVCFYHSESQQLIGGDVLFQGSIGRTDLPGGDHETLLESIRQKLYVLPDDARVYPGHGPSTTIGYETGNNPFVRR